MTNIFLEKSNTKSVGETSFMPFSEKSKLSLFLDQYSKVLYNLFILYVMLQIEGYQNILKLSWRPLVFTSYKAFLKKTEKRFEASLRALFSAMVFEEKCFSCYILYFIFWFPLLRQISGNMCIVIVS